jgi:lambda repressor-like predicted transcriptional regulator
MKRKSKHTGLDKFSIEEVVDAIIAANGSRIDAADTLGTDPKTIWRYAQKYPRVQEALDDADHIVGQLARNAIIDGIMGGDAGCAKWFLTHNKTVRSDWSERTEITGANGGAIQTETRVIDTPPAANSIEEWLEIKQKVQAARTEVAEALED